MVIRKMNSIFARHGRYLLGGLTLVICVAFIGLFTPGFSSLFSGTPSEQTYGKCFGEDVTRTDWLHQLDKEIIFADLQYGMGLQNNFIRNSAQRVAFQRLCITKAAERSGIIISDKQVADFIHNIPRFQNAGKFDIKKFQDYLNGPFKAAGYAKYELDDAVKSGLASMEIMRQISNNVIVTDDEVTNFYNIANEKFFVQVARFNATDYSKEIKLDDKEIAADFELQSDSYNKAKTEYEKAKKAMESADRDAWAEAKKKFDLADAKYKSVERTANMIPANFKIDVVRFDYGKYTKLAEETVTKVQIKDYYEANKEKYIKITPPVPAAKGDALKKEPVKPKKEYRSLEEVSADIKVELAAKKAKQLAEKAGREFANDCFTAIEDSETPEEYKKNFSKFCANKKVKVISSDWFAADAKQIKGIGKEPKLIQVVANSFQPLTEAVTGERSVFIALITEKEERRLAKLEEVKDKVARELKEKKAVNFAREKAKEAALKVGEAIKAGKKFDAFKELAKFEQADFTLAFKFRAGTPPYFPNGTEITDMASKIKTGAVSPVKNTSTGALFVYVEKRELPAKEIVEKDKTPYVKILRRQKENAAMMNFQQWLQDNSKMFVRTN